MPIISITVNTHIWYDITLGALVFFRIIRLAMFDAMKNRYAQPLNEKLKASRSAAITAPQKETYSRNFCILHCYYTKNHISSLRYLINMNMKLKDLFYKDMIAHLTDLCKRELQLSEMPKIVLIDNKSTVPGGTSFGQFGNDEISVVIHNRHPMDIMRTLAHELIHWRQQLSGHELDGSDGSDIENQANAVAGIIMRKFGKKYPQYFVNSLP